MDVSSWIAPAVGLAGLVAGYFVGQGTRGSHGVQLERERAQAAQERAVDRAQQEATARELARVDGQLTVLREEYRQVSLQLQDARADAARWQGSAEGHVEQLGELRLAAGAREQELRGRVQGLQGELTELGATASRLEAELRAERAAGAERLEAARSAEAERQEAARKADEERREFLALAQRDMSHSFQKVAADLLEEKSKRFTDHNRVNIEQLLTPLREKLGEFQNRVEGLQQEGLVGRTELKTQIESLRGLNEKLSADANNLVKALKNSSKQQGDWGEVLLVGMLEDAGLRAGQEYRVQTSFATDEGRQLRPDIILNLPDAKHLVIDSKVSLTSYTDSCSCEDEAARKVLLERHALSLRNHIDSLDRKQYQRLHQINSLDFVMMFVPIEPAYLMALAHDPGLWQRAWNKDVLLVSPGTLFPVIRTIAHMWQQEKQTKNVEEILRQAGGLYDKVALFAESFVDVGKQIDKTKLAYTKSLSQLKDGNGDVLTRIARLEALGVKTKKKLPAEFRVDDVEEADAEGGGPSRKVLPGLPEPPMQEV